MFPKSLSYVLSAALLASSSAVMAAGYSPDDYLNLDLSKAVLSPTPLGPPAHFVAVPAKAAGDGAGEVKTNGNAAGDSSALPAPDEAADVQQQVRPPRHVAERPRGEAHRRGNPLDARAQVVNRRIHVWPCRSGAICNWKRSPSAQ